MSRWANTLTPAALAELMAVVCQIKPEIDEAPILIGEGISTLAYGVTSPDDAWVLRVSRLHPDPWTWRGGRGQEVWLLAEFRRRGIPVPAEAMVVAEVDGLPTAILERRVVGMPLSPQVAGSDPRLPARIALVLDRLHAMDIDDAVLRGVPRDDPTGEFRRALAVVDLDDGLRLRVEAALRLLEGRVSIRVLCHRDFRVEHLIVDDDGEVVGLLDLGEVGIDDPAVDLAFLYGELGRAVVDEICAVMETADAGLSAAARAFHSLWPLLELAPGGEWWGDPATARFRLDASV